MNVHHMLTLLPSMYANELQAGAQKALNATQAPKAHQQNDPEKIFHQFFGTRGLSDLGQQKPKEPVLSLDEHKDNLVQIITSACEALVTKIQKSLDKGVNTGSILLRGIPSDTSHQTLIIRDIFNKYLGVEITTTEKDSTLTYNSSWNAKDSKFLLAAFGKGPKNPESKLNDLRLKNTLCDCTLKVGDTEFRAHRVILAKKCPYFETMFTTNMREAEAGTPISLLEPTLNPQHFTSILNFIYTGTVDLRSYSHAELITLAQLAKMMLLPKLECICTRLLITKLHPSTWIDIATYACSTKSDTILLDHCSHAATHYSIVETLRKKIESAAIDVACSYYDLSFTYSALSSLQLPLASHISKHIDIDSFEEYCDLGSSFANNSPSRSVIEKNCRTFVDLNTPWINLKENESIKQKYVFLLSGVRLGADNAK